MQHQHVLQPGRIRIGITRQAVTLTVRNEREITRPKEPGFDSLNLEPALARQALTLLPSGCHPIEMHAVKCRDATLASAAGA